MFRSLPRQAASSIGVAAIGLAISLLAGPAFGVVSVGGNGNTTAPSDDPGFANVGVSSTGGASVTYLGNGWCITASHVTIANMYPNLSINGKNYQITQQIGNSAFGGADLQLFQINGDPGLAPLSISTTTPGTGSQVTMIGNGLGSTGQQYWNVSVPTGWGSSSPGTWTSTTSGGSVTPLPATAYWNGGPVSPGTYQASGLSLDSNHVIRWGQNLITKINQSDGATQYFYTTFNDPTYSPDQSSVGSEAQAVIGDSGGGVFYKVPGVGWQLAGIMYAQGGFPGQAVNANGTAYTGAVFGDISGIIDLSKYRGSIQAIDTPMSWTGQIGSAWDITSMNWSSWNSILNAVTSSNSGGTYYAATFGDKNPLTNAAVANSNITIQATGVTPPSVVFNNSSAVAYTFSDATGSTAGISNPVAGGATAIIKNGAGSVTFMGGNSFTGPVFVNAGRLNLENNSALGTSSGVTVSSGAALELQNNISVGAIPLTITGAGLAASPAGALNSVSGNNSFAGPITIGSGGATINSAFAGGTLTLTGPFSLGSNPLTFSGGGNFSMTNVISGSGGLIKWGNGILFLSAANSYTGGTAVNGGVVVTNSLGDPSNSINVSAGTGVNSALLLGTPYQTQMAASLSGTVAAGASAVVSIGSTDTLTVNQATNTTFGGSIVNSGNFIKSGTGTLEIDGAPNWGTSGTIQVGGGTLKFNLISSSASVGSGVTAIVASGATLQMAGSVSALSAGSNLVNVSNDSQAAAGGVLVTGVNQHVGSISGAGSTVVAAGGNLTATSIVQSALVIGGSAANPGTLTIEASGANGSPAAATSSTGESASNSFLAYLAAGNFTLPFNGLATDSTSASPPAALSGASLTVPLSGAMSVPELSSGLLALIAVSGLVGARGACRIVRRRVAS